MIVRFVDVKLKDGTYKAVNINDIEQMLLDKTTCEITVWWKEMQEVISAPLAYWEIEGMK